MKKFFALAAMLCCGSAIAMAQSATDEFNVHHDDTPSFCGVEGLSLMGLFGMTISNLPGNYGTYKNYTFVEESMGAKVGFTAGARLEYILPQCYGVFINGGLEYTLKGGRRNDSEVVSPSGPAGATAIARAYYLQVPLHIGYRYDLLDNLGIYADFGPYFALGTNGKCRYKYDSYDDDYTEKFFKGYKEVEVKDENDETQMKPKYKFMAASRWDCGLGFRLGAEYAKHYNLQLGFDWGLLDILTQKQKKDLVNYDPAMRNFNANITFGYRF